MNQSKVALIAVVLTLVFGSSAMAAGGGYITGDMSSTVVARPFVSAAPVVQSAPVWQGAPVASPCCSQPVTTFRPVVVAQPQPVVAYRPVVVAPRRVVTYYAPPVYAAPRYVTNYAPVAAPAPAVYGRPVVVRTKVYVPGQPIRNALRWVAP